MRVKKKASVHSSNPTVVAVHGGPHLKVLDHVRADNAQRPQS